MYATHAGGPAFGVLHNQGDGTFAAPVYAAVNQAAGDRVTFADVNGDGKIDIVSTDSNTGDVAVLLGQGNGAFAPAVHATGGAGPWCS